MSENVWRVTGEEVYPKGNNPLDNHFYGYRKTHLLLPDGRDATYHGLVVPECVHTVAIEDDLTTYAVWQKRPNVRKVGQTDVPKTLELPGGFSTGGLSLAESANKELAEEVGRHATQIERIGSIYPSTGVSNEEDHIFLGTGLEAVRDTYDEATEQDMRIIAEPFGQLYGKLLRSEIPVSGQTLAAFAMTAARL
jgi:hypothetical protein